MTTNSIHAPIILASKSPRRKYLLKKAGIPFKVVVSAVDEARIPAAPPEAYVQTLALAKAADVAARYPRSWVIGADTVVLIDDRILGKPGSREEARAMLRSLSGQTHRVLTGVAICHHERERTLQQVVKTDVLFKRLTEDEIEWYVHTSEPFDKAGAYAIQGLGTFLVRSINGSYTNVVGLPVCEVIEQLIREGAVGRDAASQEYRIQNGG